MIKAAPQLVSCRAIAACTAWSSKFIKDDQLRQAFSFHTLLVGGNPFNTRPSTRSSIPWKNAGVCRSRRAAPTRWYGDWCSCSKTSAARSAVGAGGGNPTGGPSRPGSHRGRLAGQLRCGGEQRGRGIYLRKAARRHVAGPAGRSIDEAPLLQSVAVRDLLRSGRQLSGLVITASCSAHVIGLLKEIFTRA